MQRYRLLFANHPTAPEQNLTIEADEIMVYLHENKRWQKGTLFKICTAYHVYETHNRFILYYREDNEPGRLAEFPTLHALWQYLAEPSFPPELGDALIDCMLHRMATA
jgi:hypothetical protein